MEADWPIFGGYTAAAEAEAEAKDSYLVSDGVTFIE